MSAKKDPAAAAIAEIRMLFKEWRETFLRCRPLRKMRVLVVGIGRFNDAIQPQEFPLMATGKMGQFAPLVATPKTAAGDPGQTDATPPKFSSDDTSVAVIVDHTDGKQYVNLVGQGSATLSVEIDADPTDGVSTITGVGLVVCDDPADNATTVELTVGPLVDALLT